MATNDELISKISHEILFLTFILGAIGIIQIFSQINANTIENITPLLNGLIFLIWFSVVFKGVEYVFSSKYIKNNLLANIFGIISYGLFAILIFEMFIVFFKIEGWL